jgi:hypothetical protein
MGEPQTFYPEIVVDDGDDVFSLQVETEGLRVAFDIDADRIQQLIFDLQMEHQKYTERKDLSNDPKTDGK